MRIRRVSDFTAIAALGLLAGVAQGQAVVTYSGETNTVQSPAGTHQLPSYCTPPSSTLVASCVALNQSNLTVAMMELSTNPGFTYTWGVSSGKLPTGLGINATTGVISGTPTAAGVYSFVITATLSNLTTINSIVYTIVTGSGLPTITQTQLPTTAESGQPVPSNFYTAVATGGYPCVTSSTYCIASNPLFTPYYTWSIQGGAVDGLGINSTTGAITGTPLGGGSFQLTIQATDGLGQAAASFTATLSVNGAANFMITTGSLPNGTVNTAYSQPIATTGGPSSGITFNVVAGNLPPGINNCTSPSSGISCTLSGTPTVAGTYNFSMQGTYNSSGTINSNIQPYTVTIAQPSGVTLSLPAPASQSVAINQAGVSMTFAATGGTTPYTYSQLFSAPFPTGLTLNASTGVLSGTTTATGTFPFTVEVTDNTGAKASASSTITVGGTLSLPAPAAQTVTIGQAVNMQFTAGGGVTPYTYTVSAGGLPPTLSLNASTGAITGTIAASDTGTYTFTIQVKDNANVTTTAQSSITVGSISLSSPAAVTVAAGLSAAQQFTATGGTQPYSYSITGATFNGGTITVPSGMTINASSGLLTFATTVGTAPGTYVPTVQATDSASHTTTAQGSVTVTASTLSINTPAAVTVIVGQNVSLQFTATGGTAPYTYSRASGALPPGVSLAGSTGLVSGTTTAAGTYTFTIEAADAASGTAFSNTASITANAALTLPSPATVTGVNGQTLTMQFTAAGGTGPYTYSITGVTLNGTTVSTPATLTINSLTGLLTFVTTSATAQGPYVVTVQAKDSASTQATTTGTGTITLGASLTMANPSAITNGVVGQPLSMQFTAVGGTPPYTYAYLTGNLPPGLNLNTATGLLSGTPTAAGSYGFTIQATDSATPALTANAQGIIILQSLSLIGSNITINIPGAATGPLTPNTQPQITLSIGAPLQQDIQGTLLVSFRRVDNQLSSEVSFPGQGVNPQAVNFKIPAGTTTAVFGTSAFTQMKTGTAAGSGQISATFQDLLGNNITPPSLQPVQFSVAASAPVLSCAGCGFTLSLPTAATGTTPGGTYTANVVGYSTTLGVSSVTFNFTATTGTQLSNSSVTVDVQSAFQAWFGSTSSNPTGGQFRLKIPLNFTVSGGSQSNPIAGATVTVTNSQGTVTSTSAIPQ